MIPAVTTNIDDLGHKYTRANHVEHPTRADFIWTQNHSEEDISSAGSECEKENMCNNTVIIDRQTDIDLQRTKNQPQKETFFRLTGNATVTV